MISTRVKLAVFGAAITAVLLLLFVSRRESTAPVRQTEKRALRVDPQDRQENEPKWEPISGGDATIRGRVLMPDGANARDGTTVFVIGKERLFHESPLGDLCACASCTLAQAQDACEYLEPSILRRIDEGTVGVAPELETITRDGNFVFSQLQPGEYLVWSHPDGAASTTAEVILEKAADVTLNALDASQVSGRVTLDDDSPATEARVLAIDPLLGELHQIETDENGVYRLVGLSPRTWWWIIAADEQHAPAGAIGVEADEKDVDLVLVAAATLSGVVVDNGRPVAGAEVDVGDDQPVVMTDAAGRFNFDVIAPGYRSIYASRDRRSAELEIDLDAGEQREVRLELLPTCEISVHVFDPDQQPLVNASVRAIPPDALEAERRGVQSEIGVEESELEIAEQEEEEDESSPSFDWRIDGTELSDEDGLAEIEDLPLGTYVIEVSHHALGNAEGRVTCDADGLASLQVTLGAEPGLRGVLLTPERQPIAGGTVELELEVEGRQEAREVVTDKEGLFRAGSLQEGSWKVFAIAVGFVPTWREVEIGKTDRDETIELVLERTKRLRGTVLLADGTRLGGWRVSAWPKNRDLVNEHFSNSRETMTLADGTFEVLDVAAGEYFLDARGPLPDGEEQMSAGASGSTDNEVTITVGSFGIIEGELFVEGAPMPNEVQVAIGDTMLVLTQENRRFRVRVRPSPFVSIQANAESFPIYNETVQVDAGEVKQTQIVLRAGAIVEGLVFEQRTKKPVAGAYVMFDREQSFEAQKALRFLGGHEPIMGLTDKNGRFEVRGFSPGSFSVTAQHDRYSTSRIGPLVIRGGAQPLLEIPMESGLVAAGVVRFGETPAESGSVVFDRIDQRQQESSSIDRYGRFRATLPSGGDWRVRITIPDDRAAGNWIIHELIVSLTIPPSGKDDLSLLVPAGQARLTVEVPSPRRAGEILLVSGAVSAEEASYHQIRARPGVHYSAQLYHGGKTATFSSLVPGDYTLIHRPDGFTPKLTPIRISGDQKVALTGH